MLRKHNARSAGISMSPSLGNNVHPETPSSVLADHPEHSVGLIDGVSTFAGLGPTGMIVPVVAMSQT
jgi:hypothetical protein